MFYDLGHSLVSLLLSRYHFINICASHHIPLFFTCFYSFLYIFSASSASFFTNAYPISVPCNYNNDSNDKRYFNVILCAKMNTTRDVRQKVAMPLDPSWKLFS